MFVLKDENVSVREMHVRSCTGTGATSKLDLRAPIHQRAYYKNKCVVVLEPSYMHFIAALRLIRARNQPVLRTEYT